MVGKVEICGWVFITFRVGHMYVYVKSSGNRGGKEGKKEGREDEVAHGGEGRDLRMIIRRMCRRERGSSEIFFLRSM
jgi:hypothetical protein